MKTVTSITAIILTLTLTLSAAVFPGNQLMMFSRSMNGQVVKATQVGDQLIPVVNLPVIHISAEGNESVLRNAVIWNGEVVALEDLPVINITAMRVDNDRLPAIIYNGKIIASLELPVIEISGSFPTGKMVKAVYNENNTMPVVDLPLINISADISSGKLIKAITENEKIVAIVDLPVIEITSYYPLTFTQTYEPVLAQNENIQWFYVTLKNCGINITGERICEVVSKARVSSSSLLYANLKKVIEN